MSSSKVLSKGSLSNNAGYRPDIDGLRAIAIVSVIIFHAFPTVLTGGFVGVDVFFVISGYLISGIVFRDVSANRFSFLSFFSHRIKRIFPALMAVLFASLACGWFVLLPIEYRQLGRHAESGVKFVLNYTLWSESGYFDIASELKPLMHLWSLSIEEQFYVIFPLLLWLAWWVRFDFLAVILPLWLLSFMLNISEVDTDGVKAFFSPETRFWELMSGSMLAYLQVFKKEKVVLWMSGAIARLPPSLHCNERFEGRSLLSLLGLMLIVWAVIFFEKNDVFPGYRALLPVIGTSLLILAGSDAWVNRRILASRILVFFGVISYPLYLWHWPLLSFSQIIGSDIPSVGARTLLVLLSILLAWITYQFVERPIRFGFYSWRRTALLIACMALVGVAGNFIYETGGLSNRAVASINPSIVSVGGGGAMNFVKNECGLKTAADAKRFAYCQRDVRAESRFALLGDSKAAALAPGVFRQSKERGGWLFLGGTSEGGTTVPVISNAEIYAPFQPVARLALDTLLRNNGIKVVVITTATRHLFHMAKFDSIDELLSNDNFTIAFSGLNETISRLVRAGKKVVLTVDNPSLKDPKQCMVRKTSLGFVNQLMGLQGAEKCDVSYDRHLTVSAKYRLLLDELARKYPGRVKLFDTLPYLCDMQRRVCPSMLEGKLMYSYTDHISVAASLKIAHDLIPFVEEFARQSGG